MTLDVNRPDLTVGVVGTGAMGRGIAQVTAQGGIEGDPVRRRRRRRGQGQGGDPRDP